MKKARILFIIVLTAMLAAGALPGTAQDGGSPISLPDEIAGGREVTISVSAAINDLQDNVLKEWYDQIVRFQQAYPNVTVETVFYGFAPDTFAALVAAEEVPTLFEVPFTEPRKLIRQGIPADLSSLFEEYGIGEVFQPAILDTVKGAEGGVYGFPTFAYSQGIAYHIPALEAAGYEGPPDTWTELPEMAAALTDRDAGLSGFAMNMAGGGGGWHFTNVAYGFGADLVKIDEDGNYIATYGEGAAVDAMQLIYDLRWKYDALPYDLESNPILLLVADQAAIAMNPGDGLGWVNINMPDVDMAQFGYGPVPAGPDGKRYALIGGSVTMINSAATEDEQEAAFVYQMWRQLSEEEFVPSRKIHHMGQAGQGAPVLTIYQGAFQEMVDEVDAEFVTMPVENYQAYYDALNSGEVVLVPEPAAAQDFYVAIAEVLTEVLTDENADVAALMKTSAEEFQAGVLDFIE